MIVVAVPTTQCQCRMTILRLKFILFLWRTNVSKYILKNQLLVRVNRKFYNNEEIKLFFILFFNSR